MPGGAVATALGAGLFGKLPAHGDFVRRGSPVMVQRLDQWLSGGLYRLATADEGALERRMDALDPWHFALDDGTAGALLPSRDKVGRAFPIVAAVRGGSLVADRVGAAIAAACVQGQDADTLHDLLCGMSGGEPDGQQSLGWWRPGAGVAEGAIGVGWPSDGAFAALFGVDPCQR